MKIHDPSKMHKMGEKLISQSKHCPLKLISREYNGVWLALKAREFDRIEDPEKARRLFKIELTCNEPH
jgi:hypothetical protein